MENSSIQDKLNFFARMGTRNVFQTNRMVNNISYRRLTRKTPDNETAEDRVRVIENIQLQLFQ